MKIKKRLLNLFSIFLLSAIISCEKNPPLYKGRFPAETETTKTMPELGFKLISVEILSFDGFGDYSNADGLSGPDICFSNPSIYKSIFDVWYPNPVNNVLPSSLPRKFTEFLPEYENFGSIESLKIVDSDPGQGLASGEDLLEIRFENFTTKLGIHRVKALQGEVVIEYHIFEK